IRDFHVTGVQTCALPITGVTGVGDNLFGKINDINDSLFNAGNISYNFEEKKRQTMQQFQEALKNKKYDDALKLLSAVNETPKERTEERSVGEESRLKRE